MTTEQIQDWLDSTGQNREWLAAQLRSTKGSVDQFFSRGFPGWAVQIITLLKAQMSAGVQLKFSPEEWRLIQRAMADAGYVDEFEYFRDAIMVYSEQLVLNDDKDPKKAKKMMPIAASLAEKQETYRAKRKEA